MLENELEKENEYLATRVNVAEYELKACKETIESMKNSSGQVLCEENNAMKRLVEDSNKKNTLLAEEKKDLLKEIKILRSWVALSTSQLDEANAEKDKGDSVRKCLVSTEGVIDELKRRNSELEKVIETIGRQSLEKIGIQLADYRASKPIKKRYLMTSNVKKLK